MFNQAECDEHRKSKSRKKSHQNLEYVTGRKQKLEATKLLGLKLQYNRIYNDVLQGVCTL